MELDAELQASLSLSGGTVLRVALLELGPEEPDRLLLVFTKPCRALLLALSEPEASGTSVTCQRQSLASAIDHDANPA